MDEKNQVRLEEWTARKQEELGQVKKNIFGGYQVDAVEEFFDRMLEEITQMMKAVKEEQEQELQILRSQNNALIQENQNYILCIEEVCGSLSSVSQSFLDRLEQDRDLEERRHVVSDLTERSQTASDSEEAPQTASDSEEELHIASDSEEGQHMVSDSEEGQHTESDSERDRTDISEDMP